MSVPVPGGSNCCAFHCCPDNLFVVARTRVVFQVFTSLKQLEFTDGAYARSQPCSYFLSKNSGIHTESGSMDASCLDDYATGAYFPIAIVTKRDNLAGR